MPRGKSGNTFRIREKHWRVEPCWLILDGKPVTKKLLPNCGMVEVRIYAGEWAAGRGGVVGGGKSGVVATEVPVSSEERRSRPSRRAGVVDGG